MDFTISRTVDTTGAWNGSIMPVLEFPASDIQSMLLGVDGACHWGFGSVDMAVKPLGANKDIGITHQDFTDEVKINPLKTVKVYVKADAATVNVTISYIGRF